MIQFILGFIVGGVTGVIIMAVFALERDDEND